MQWCMAGLENHSVIPLNVLHSLGIMVQPPVDLLVLSLRAP